MFPEAGHYDQAVFWTGLRPSTPSNVPLVGATRFGNRHLGGERRRHRAERGHEPDDCRRASH
jgi:hypothetical protein